MKRLGSALDRLFSLLPRVALMSVLLAAPVLAVPMSDYREGVLLEAPTQKNSGMGLVILVSLQRG
jgi:hypothetical protein